MSSKQRYRFLIMELVMNEDDEDFLDLIWKLCLTEAKEVPL